MFNIPLATSSDTFPEEVFWEAVLLYHDRPHLVNRRLLGAVTAVFLKVDFLNDDVRRVGELFTRAAILYEIRKLKGISNGTVTKEFVKNILETFDKEVELEEKSMEDFLKSSEDVYVSVRILYPRHPDYENCVEVAVLDKKNSAATFHCVTEFDKKAIAPSFPYDVEYSPEGNLRVCVSSTEDAEHVNAGWLCDHLFLKLIKWMENCNTVDDNSIQSSLSLIPFGRYAALYKSLKLKYGRKIVGIWPERTDPLKYVYEDVAIAAYLICLWQLRHPDRKPSFVDLGCGNGLLVHILTEEGFPGCGVDVRGRKIWNMYPKTTVLKVQPITPSSSSLFPETDWIIGNHSDELTPWIPVIAMRSSYKTNFFLLPCCSYEFNGEKYIRADSSISVYTDYLKYVQDICHVCQFNIKMDKLRIPSTKRTCIVSAGRQYSSDRFAEIDKNVERLIKRRCSGVTPESDGWIAAFKPRSDVEKVRNCTQLGRDFISSVVDVVLKLLLESKNVIEKSDGGTWNKGGVLCIKEVVEKIGSENLQKLKKECGGLQTLLKNHPYIFNVHEGSVELQVPKTVEATSGKYRSKPCWFHKNHPNGCFNVAEKCAQSHEM